MQRTQGPDGAPKHTETGFLRVTGPAPDGGHAVEMTVAHPTGIAEVLAGVAIGDDLQLRSAAVALTPTAKQVDSIERRLRLHGGRLVVDTAMAAWTALTHHRTSEADPVERTTPDRTRNGRPVGRPFDAMSERAGRWPELRSPPCLRASPPPASSGLSAMTASVVRNRAAIDAAFCSAERVTLAASMMPALTRSSYSPVAALRPSVGGVEVAHPLDDHAALEAGVDGDLLERLLEGAGHDAGTGGLVGRRGPWPRRAPRPGPAAG